MKYLSAEQILFIHFRLIEETGGSHGVRDMDMLLSAIGRAQSTFDRQELYPDIADKAAALMESLIRNHPFVDGNKRTGVTAAGLFLLQNGYRLTASNAELVELARGIAQSQRTFNEIRDRLQRNIQPVP
jgi:death-on-curing protein